MNRWWIPFTLRFEPSPRAMLAGGATPPPASGGGVTGWRRTRDGVRGPARDPRWWSWLVMMGSLCGSVTAHAQCRTQNCPAGVPRDPEGFCVLRRCPDTAGASVRPTATTTTGRGARLPRCVGGQQLDRARNECVCPAARPTWNAARRRCLAEELVPPVATPPTPPVVPPAVEACPQGQLRSADTENHCCWPGQYWVPSQRACGGAPRCPGGMEAVGGTCLASCSVGERREAERCACEAGRVRSADTRDHCCWPGQVWVPSRNACVGAPGCPAGLTAQGDACVEPPPAGMARVAGRSREGQVYDFFMDRTEVTVSAYAACVNAGACSPAAATVEWPGMSAAEEAEHSPFCNARRGGVGNHPVNCVNAAQADAYCVWRDARLPTEQEWQFAAQGPDGRSHPWGEDPPSGQLCWNRWASRAGTCAVGSFPSGRSPFGLDDMAGNVWEWTSSSESSNRVVRGGSWDDTDPARVRATRRNALAPTIRYYVLGFRCARGAR